MRGWFVHGDGAPTIVNPGPAANAHYARPLTPPRRRAFWPSMKPAATTLVVLAVMGGLYFTAAGRWDLPWSWACLGLIGLLTFFTQWAMDPELRRERLKPGPGG